jgi:hypothetical protein
MTVSILAFCLAAQVSPTAHEGTRRDLEFMRGVEEFVIASEPRQAPPEPYRGLIERLGDPSWREREAASKELQTASAQDQRWLFWGRRHADLEARLRSNAILRRLNPCSTCKGSGNSKNWEAWPCWECDGTATAWPWSIWD